MQLYFRRHFIQRSSERKKTISKCYDMYTGSHVAPAGSPREMWLPCAFTLPRLHSFDNEPTEGLPSTGYHSRMEATAMRHSVWRDRWQVSIPIWKWLTVVPGERSRSALGNTTTVTLGAQETLMEVATAQLWRWEGNNFHSPLGWSLPEKNKRGGFLPLTLNVL